MADKRKLQSEIDRCLKKVTEGVEIFEDLWQKVHNATNYNIKEKHEADLKKEIKKLQRLRDAIKTWLTSSEIKDKKNLLDYKKLIEMQMERFKVVERETKTKAYSKEGLVSATKVDPKEKEKEDITVWLNHSIDLLNVQIDQCESEIEAFAAKKKKPDKDKQDQGELIRQYLEKHRFHVDRLETVMRLVDNDALPLDQIVKIKEDVEYYIHSNREPDFEDNEFLYDDLKLDEVSAALGSKLAAMSSIDDEHSSNLSDISNASSGCPSPSPSATSHAKDHSNDTSRARLKSQSEETNHNTRTGSTSSQSKQSGSVNNITSKVSHLTLRQTSLSSSPLDSQTMVLSSNSTVAAQNYAKVASGGGVNNALSDSSNAVRHNHSSSSAMTPTLMPSSLTPSTRRPSSSVFTSDDMNADVHFPGQQSSYPTSSNQQIRMSETDGELMATTNDSLIDHSNSQQSPLAAFIAKNSLSEQAPTDLRPTLDSMDLRYSDVATSQVSSLNAITSQVLSTLSLTSSSSCIFLSTMSSSNSSHSMVPTTVRIDPILGLTPLGQVPLNKQQSFHLTMLEAAACHMPLPMDSQHIRVHHTPAPCSMPSHYWQLPPHLTDSIEFFLRLQPDTLFYMFYYMEGTKAQYMAAKALKQLSWRFHTKYMMWFQRHEEPKLITEEFEQGTYLYFDYEKWMQRKREGFVFEYKYLEDRDLN